MCCRYINVTLLLEILHVPVLHLLLDSLLVLVRGGGAAGVQHVVGQVHGGGLLREEAHPAVLPGGGQHLGLVSSMLGKERVDGLVAHGGGQLVCGVIASEARQRRVSVQCSITVIIIFFAVVIIILLVILETSNVAVSWSKLTEGTVAGVGVSGGHSVDDAIIMTVLFILTLGVGLAVAVLEPVLRSSRHTLTRPRSVCKEIVKICIGVHSTEFVVGRVRFFRTMISGSLVEMFVLVHLIMSTEHDIEVGLVNLVVVAGITERLRETAASEALERLGAGDAVHVEHVEHVADNLGLEVNCALDLALGDALHSLAYRSNNSNILAVKKHPRHLDVEQGDPHLVDEVQVDEVVGAGGEVRGACHSEGDLAADEGIVGTSLHLHAVRDDVQFLFFCNFHD